MKFLGAVVACVAYAFLFSASYPGWKVLSNLSRDGIATSAVVVGKDEVNHRRVRYEFFVDQRTYPGQGSAGKGGVPDFDRLEVGDRIKVTYQPGDPFTSISGTPGQRYMAWNVMLFVLGPLASIGAGYFTYRRLVLLTRRRSSPVQG